MIERIEISGVRVDVDQDIKKYIHKKIGRLDRLMPRHARKSAHAKVVLSETKGKLKKPTCEVVLELPSKTLTAKEAAVNMFSSVDVVEAKLANQIRKYKDTHSPSRARRTVRKFLGKARRG